MSAPASSLDESAEIEGPAFDRVKGVWVFEVTSQFLNGQNKVEVLLPDRPDSTRSLRVLYVLPVSPGIGGPWGDGLQIVRQLGSHNEHNLICVSPAFDTWPFYGAHATNPRIRHEDYVLKVLVPLIESRYETRGTPGGRLLMGFSKSGRGAFLLILRNPEVFGYACAFDAKLMMSEKQFGIWQTAMHYGTRDAMSGFVPEAWARKNASWFQQEARLALLGTSVLGIPWFPERQTHAFHRILRQLRMKHYYDCNVNAPHTWNAGWVAPAVRALTTLAS